MAALGALQAKAAPARLRAAPARGQALQTKLEVGPSHDRFEAEADRVAASVVSHGGPSGPPAISPLPAGEVSRAALQREEKRPIEQREKGPDAKSGALSELIQSKPRPERKNEEEKVQAKPRPDAKRDEDRKLQTKRQPDKKREDEKLQAKRQPQLPGPRKEEDPASKLAQKKPANGVLQRDSIDDDTVLETTIQAKREAAQRARATADTAIEQEEPKPSGKVQRAAGANDGFTAPSGVEAGISAMRGRGAPLAPPVRRQLEPRFGRDLSGVRIHDGAAAAKLSHDVHARAFTIGQDIFFGAGQYQPASSDGRALLAHEVTHTIQQGGGSARAQPARIQRDTKSKGKAPDPATPEPEFENKKVGKLKVDGAQRILQFNALPVPKIGKEWKGTGAGSSPAKDRPALRENGDPPWQYLGKTPRGGVTARQAWLAGIRSDTKKIEDRIGEMSEKAGHAKDPAKADITRNGQPVIYLRPDKKSGDGQNFLLIGTAGELAKCDEILLPIWNAKGRGTLFDVDHIHELQLGGADGFENFWLLDQSANRSSGSNIARTMREDFDTLVAAAEKADYFKNLNVPVPNWEKIRLGQQDPANKWQVEYVGLRKIAIEGNGDTWTKDGVKAGDHLEPLSALTQKEIMERGLVYDANPENTYAYFYALNTGRGGFYRRVKYDKSGKAKAADSVGSGGAGGSSVKGENQFYRGLGVGPGGIQMAVNPKAPAGKGDEAVSLLGTARPTELKPGDVIATITGTPFSRVKQIEKDPVNLKIHWLPELGYGGYVDKGWINEMMGRLSIEGMSPIQVHEAGLNAQGEIFANGEIIATKALFPNLRVPIYLQGNEVGIRFPIPTDKLNFGPVRVTQAAIDVGFGDHGVFLAGSAGLAIDQVGSGTVTARVTREDTILEGEFNFDLDFLDPAQARIRYSFAKDTLALTLNAGVKKGVLPGVNAGKVTATFSRESVDVTGTLELAAPFSGSSITVGYTKETGLTIAADNIPLPVSKIPGVQDASLSAKANYNPDDGGWHLSGEGKASFSVPPATGTLTVGLDGQIVTIRGTASFQQGIAAGALDVTATNAQLDEAGQPVPGKMADQFSVFGSGQASLKFGILTGTAALELTREGKVIITGTISLPPSHPVFERKEYKRELLHVKPPEFPIWGFSIAGVGVGVFAFVDAKLTADAFVGPGTLENTQVSVTFDLDRPEDAVVDGTAAFVVPAGAGMTLDIGGGLRARAAVAYVEGRVGLDARLGILAQARTDVALHWTSVEGLSLAASAHAEAHPQFEVGANASIKAGVDLGLFDVSKTWGPWRKVLGSFGPELTVGVTMPIAWSERKGLDFSADKVELTYPDIDFGSLMTDGFMKLI